MILVMMGVSGSGKTTVGEGVARRLGVRFADADTYHSEANRAKMAGGTPLTDEDRWPWLEALHAVLAGWVADGGGGVLACSALKGAYREVLVRGLPVDAVEFVLLEVSPALLAKRLAARQGHFMGPALLGTQLATLEDPGETAFRVRNDGLPETAVETIVAHLGAGLGAGADAGRGGEA